MRFTVGGRELDVTADQVRLRMTGVEPEPIQKHAVEIAGSLYPPKQVLAQVSGFDRSSFTTMEAQRVLARLGFVGHRSGQASEAPPRVLATDPPTPGAEERLAALEARLTVHEQALAQLTAQMRTIESALAT
jgi:hypothetical protein